MIIDDKRLLQRGRGRETAERMRASGLAKPTRSFNGAAVVRPRRGGDATDDAARAGGFNGAAVVRPRRGLAMVMSSATEGELQRGRGRETAESDPPHQPATTHPAASTGPRS